MLCFRRTWSSKRSTESLRRFDDRWWSDDRKWSDDLKWFDKMQQSWISLFVVFFLFDFTVLVLIFIFQIESLSVNFFQEIFFTNESSCEMWKMKYFFVNFLQLNTLKIVKLVSKSYITIPFEIQELEFSESYQSMHLYHMMEHPLRHGYPSNWYDANFWRIYETESSAIYPCDVKIYKLWYCSKNGAPFFSCVNPWVEGHFSIFCI